MPKMIIQCCLITLAFFLSSASAEYRNNRTCGISPGRPLTAGSFGPYDYTNPSNLGKKLSVVETHHFTPNVEALIRGQGGTIEQDIQYTLRKFPNHHRALNSMMRYSRLKKLDYNELFTMECLFKRALYFKPDDAIVYLLYGIHHHKNKSLKAAEQKYLKALSLQPKHSGIHYNLGLLYFDTKDFKKSLVHAKFAYQNGYPFSGLKNKLKSKNIKIK